MTAIVLFFAGALLCNSIPHLTRGLSGAPFPTPFAKPHGIGDSSPLVNVLWGSVNLLAGTVLLTKHPATVGLNPEFAALAIGFLVVGIFASQHFGKVRRNKRTDR
ncbi:MAG TPA: hypothetical protein VK558_02945 [Patescibacteria group bacterium]|nr:hypothetical protein [Patescibacteria group bacterium]